jgi:hypothetical protein
MFCPSCGSEERQASQFCRACGTDLRAVHMGLERPDSITASAESSPAEKRLRRLRAGTITALVSLAVGIPSTLLLPYVPKGEPQIWLGTLSLFALIAFITGLGLLINGLLFSKPRKEIADRSSHALAQELLDGGSARTPAGSRVEPNSLLRAPTTSNLVHPPGSVTEHTTVHLKSER